MRVIERFKKGKYTAEIVQTETGLYRYSVFSVAESTEYDTSYTPSIQTAYMWLVGLLAEWSDAISLYNHRRPINGYTGRKET